MVILFGMLHMLVATLAVIAVAIALAAIAPRPAREEDEEKDVFGFDALPRTPEADLPALRRYTARDGEQLAWRFYDSAAEQILVFIHGSSAHGRSYHHLAAAIAAAGAAKVVLPNLRGHYLSGRRRGDIDYVGQLEDDIADLIAELRNQHFDGPVVLGGHSSGGGFVIRFAGGAYAKLASRFLMLSPVIPTSSTLRGRSAGGWAQVSLARIIGLSILNGFGMRGFNALPVIEFNKPVRFRDGSETLAYSHRLSISYQPRTRYAADVRKLADKGAVLIGEHDEAVDAQRLRALFERDSPTTTFTVLPDTNHFEIFTRAAVHERLAQWLMQPPAHGTRLTPAPSRAGSAHGATADLRDTSPASPHTSRRS
ncbi:alpha/beta hydrolase [Paraburkholderia pallida]|uniref:alpha/beta hydrolase n=1 Tax=Paraburkholderia pallida TaxID=2547399 RepID=UPI0014301B75|nr:alpha/beta fold hydrolase [Paraburkholderia pallida]